MTADYAAGMPSYRRWHDGEYFFFTVVTQARMAVFDKGCFRQALSDAMEQTRRERPWEMTAIVLLADHLHMVWRMPGPDKDYSGRISAWKRRFTRAYLAMGGPEAPVPEGQRRKRHRGVWQRKFWEHTIRDARDLLLHLDYIHLNPIKHGLVERPKQWAWSSFHRYVEMGQYDPDWCGRVDLPGSVEYVWDE